MNHDFLLEQEIACGVQTESHERCKAQTMSDVRMPDAPLDDEIAISAYRETGHAIACVELKVHLLSASILAGEGYAAGRRVEGDDGFVIAPDSDPFSRASEAGFRAWLGKQAVIDYAGHAAVVIMLGIGDMDDASANANGAGEDFDKAWLRLDGDPDQIEHCKASAVELITARHEQVSAVVAALLKRERLAADEIRVLVEGETSGRWEDE
jgi:hypothetical protein